MKTYKSPSSDQFAVDLFKAEYEISGSQTPNISNSIENREGLFDQWEESVTYKFIKCVIDFAEVIIMGYDSYQLTN
jgi:hypothetical protein